MAKNAIGRRALLIVLGVSLALLTLSTAIIIPFEFGRRMRLIEQEIANIVQAQLPGLEEGLWNYDARLVEAMVDGLAIYPYIDDIEVSDAAGPVVISRQREESRYPPMPVQEEKEGEEAAGAARFTHHYPLYRNEGHEEALLIGWLGFNINSSRILDDVFSQIAATLGFQLGFLVIQSVLILAIFSRMITRHLAAMAQQLRSWDIEGEHRDLSIARAPRSDELEFLVEALNTMHRTLGNALSIERAMREDLAHSLEEKQVLLQEIYHRTKNNMQLIAALLDIQALSLPEGETKAVLGEMTGRILSMALVHQKLYESQDLSRLDLGDYIQDLVGEIRHSREADTDRILFDLILEKGFIVVFDVAVPVGLAINELVTNALKHAFPDGRSGTIRIELARGLADDELVLSVSDDGVGFPAGFDMNRDSKLGLQTVINLIEQLYGSVLFHTETGVRCTMTIRKDSYRARL